MLEVGRYPDYLTMTAYSVAEITFLLTTSPQKIAWCDTAFLHSNFDTTSIPTAPFRLLIQA